MTEDNNTGNPLQEGTSDDFFNALENDVNGAIQDDINETTEVTPPKSDPEQVTHETEGSENASESNVDWEKRYKDSTREAQKMHSELSDLKPFVPVLNAMREDSGLVDHVRDYLENGGKPSQTVTEDLGLGEDFIYDSQEALQDPNSDSAKVFERSVDKIVSTRVQELASKQQAESNRAASARARAAEEKEFKERTGMSDEEFNQLMDKSKQHVMTLDDIHLIINKDVAAANTAKSTKEDMLKQMKNVRDIPTSASGANSATKADKTFEDQVFDAISSDDDVDKLFG